MAAALLLVGAASATAEPLLEVTTPDEVAVGQPFPIEVKLTNAGSALIQVTAGGAGSIAVWPGCTSPAVEACADADPVVELNPLAGSEPMVASIAPASAAGACAGQAFTAEPSGLGGWRIRPLEVDLELEGGATCTLTLSATAAALPTGDTQPAIPGRQLGAQVSAELVGASLDPAGQVDDVSEYTARVTPTVAVNPSAAVTLGSGARVSATATISGRGEPQPDGTVTLRLFGPADTLCSNPVYSSGPIPLGAANDSVSLPDAGHLPTSSGTHRWQASYSGDAHNSALRSDCASATVAVAPVAAPSAPAAPTPPAPPAPAPTAPSAPTILNIGVPPSVFVGAPTFLTVSARAGTGPVSGVQLNLGEPRNVVGLSGCRVARLGTLGSGVRFRVPHTFRRAGVHQVTVTVSSGGCVGLPRRSRETVRVVVQPTPKRDRSAPNRSHAIGHQSLPSLPRTPTVPNRPGRIPVLPTPVRRPASGCADLNLVPSNARGARRAEAAVICRLNVIRRAHKRPPVKPSPRLARAARGHSGDMLRRNYFMHENPAGPTLRSRLTRAGYRGGTYAENIGYGSDFTPARIVTAWMNSPGHRLNMLHPRMRFAGVGVGLGVPAVPNRPGATYTLNLGATLR